MDMDNQYQSLQLEILRKMEGSLTEVIRRMDQVSTGLAVLEKAHERVDDIHMTVGTLAHKLDDVNTRLVKIETKGAMLTVAVAAIISVVVALVASSIRAFFSIT